MRRTAALLVGIIIASLVLGPAATATDSTILGGYARKDGMTGQLRDSEDPPSQINFGAQTLTLTGHGTSTVTLKLYAADGVGFAIQTQTNTSTLTATSTGLTTGTGTAATQTSTRTFTDLASPCTVIHTFADTRTITNTGTWTLTLAGGAGTRTWTALNTAPATETKTLTGTLTATASTTVQMIPITMSGSGTATVTNSAIVTGTRSQAINGSAAYTATGSITGVLLVTWTATDTSNTTGTYSGTATHTGTVSGTATVSGTGSATYTQYGHGTVTDLGSQPVIMNTQLVNPGFFTVTAVQTQTATLPSGGTKTWASTLSLTSSDVCKSSPGSGDIPCLGTNSKFGTSVIPPSTDVIYAGSNVSLSTGTATATMTSANVKDGVKIHASPSATATTTATSTNTLYAADVTIRFGTDSNNVTATSATVASNPYVRANALVTPTAYTIPLAGGDNKVNVGWLPATTTPTASKIPIALTNGKIDTGWLPTVYTATYTTFSTASVTSTATSVTIGSVTGPAKAGTYRLSYDLTGQIGPSAANDCSFHMEATGCSFGANYRRAGASGGAHYRFSVSATQPIALASDTACTYSIVMQTANNTLYCILDFGVLWLERVSQ